MLSGKSFQVGAILLLFAWLAFWLYAGRYAMLDDCLIHLRYAGFLLETHTITYDGVHRSFGTSSPLYVVLLALLRTVFTGPLLPKGLSVFIYLVLVSLLVALCLQTGRSFQARALTLLLTFCLTCPMGIRWLTDGMETPLQVFLTALLAIVCDREMRHKTLHPARAASLFLLGFLMTTLRLELASLLLLVALVLFLSRIQRHPTASKFAAAARSSPLALGGVLALATIRLTLGSFLPDTALAKTGSPSLRPLADIAHLLISSLNAGIGVLLLWLVSAALLLHAARSPNRSVTGDPAPSLTVVLLGNAIFPLILALACLRGQFIQGIRYVLWCLVFSTLWNIRALHRIRALSSEGPTSPRSETLRTAYVLGPLCVLLFAILPLECYFVRPALRARGATFTELRSTPLSLLHNDRIMSADVGYLGYLSGASICDVEGLVDGRAFASFTKRERIRTCSTSSPDALFLNDFQLAEASAFLTLDRWSVCRTYDFAGVEINDRHYLLVPQPVAATQCPKLGGIPTPYTPGIAALTTAIAPPITPFLQ